MLNYKKIFPCLVVFFLLCFSDAFSQVAKSPFSYLGIGEYYGNALAHNQGMAGVGLSNPQYLFLNNQNPALLVFNRITVFEAGFIGEKRTVKGNGSSESSVNGNLNYLIMGFPALYNKWSTSFGLSPYSSVNYRLNYTDAIEGTTNTVDATETGTGGINQLFWSNGVVLHKNISVGIKASYLFGSIINEYSNTLTQNPQPAPYFPTVYERTYVKDFDFSLGFSYHKDSLFNKNYKLNIGLVYDLKAKLNTRYTARIERRDLSGQPVDSTTVINNQPGSITLPQTLGAGISFGRGFKWMTGIDYKYLDYSQFRDYKGYSQQATAGWRLAWGTEFTPDPSALSSYLKRMTYRTGISYDKYPYLINGMPVKDFGINFGFTMPVNRSSLDFALKVGKRGNLQDNTIEENYFKIYFGVTFNDQWFIRRRFD